MSKCFTCRLQKKNSSSPAILSGEGNLRILSIRCGTTIKEHSEMSHEILLLQVRKCLNINRYSKFSVPKILATSSSRSGPVISLIPKMLLCTCSKWLPYPGAKVACSFSEPVLLTCFTSHLSPGVKDCTSPNNWFWVMSISLTKIARSAVSRGWVKTLLTAFPAVATRLVLMSWSPPSYIFAFLSLKFRSFPLLSAKSMNSPV